MKYNLIGDTGVLVSELCLGAMTFGGQGFWEVIGKQAQAEVNDLIQSSLELGINFIDTANVYSEGLSETMLGVALKDLKVDREKVVVASKVRGKMGPEKNQVGLSKLHILNSIDSSLKRLQMDYIDLYQIHGVDSLTNLEETMRALEDVVRSGKVRYIGCSNLPAWMVMKANGIAEKNGWTKFVTTQNFYAIAARDIERELVPMVQDQKMGILPWSPLAGGLLSGKFTRDNQKVEGTRRAAFDFPIVDKERAFNVIDVMIEIGKGYGVSAAQVALKYILNKPAVSSVIIGAKSKDQLLDNIKSTELTLSEEDMKKLDEVSALPKEYPGWMVDFQNVERKA
jgi:aryl-alcohol dehydrogenase-like predicted oxidoreductase